MDRKGEIKRTVTLGGARLLIVGVVSALGVLTHLATTGSRHDRGQAELALIAFVVILGVAVLLFSHQREERAFWREATWGLLRLVFSLVAEVAVRIDEWSTLVAEWTEKRELAARPAIAKRSNSPAAPVAGPEASGDAG